MDDVTEIREGVHLARGSNTNWVILTEGDAATLVDTGYPGDRERVIASLAAVGRRPEDLAARGPQLLLGYFNHDRDEALASLRAMGRLDADVLLPGHGPAHDGSAATATEHARRLASA